MTLKADRLECVRGRRRLFSKLSFSLGPGQCVELMGSNGSGKTSLLRMLCGLLPPASGAVLWHGDPITSIGERFLSSVTYIGHRTGVKSGLTTLENLRVMCALNGSAIGQEEGRDVLQRVGLGRQADMSARQLSMGQLRRVALARLIACPRALWLLDEVLASLDETAVAATRSLIDEHVSEGGMAIVSTHQALRLVGLHRPNTGCGFIRYPLQKGRYGCPKNETASDSAETNERD